MSGLATLVRRVNLRYLTRRRLRAALTLVGIAAGVALVFATTIVNASVVDSVRRSVRELAGGADLEVAAATPAGLSPAIAEQVENQDGVATAAPVLRSITDAASGAEDASVLVMGITPSFLTMLPADATESLQLTGMLAPGGIVLSDDVAARLGVGVDDSIAVATPSGRPDVVVSGIIAGGPLRTINGGLVAVMHLADAQALFERPGLVDSIYVAVDEAARVETIEDQLTAVVGGAATIGRPEDRVASLTEGYGAIAAMLALTGWIALAVSLLVVHNTMAMAVADRRRELAVALSLGATRRQVLGAFVAEGAVLGLAGAVVGMGLGLGLAHLLVTDAAALANEVLPVAPEPVLTVPAYAVVAAVLGGVTIAALGAGTAARRVIAVAPVEALRPAAAHEPMATQPASRRATAAAGALLAVAVVIGVVAVVGNVQELWLVVAWLLAWMAGFGLLMPWFAARGVRLLQPLLARVAGPVGRLAGDSLLRNPGRTAVAAASLALTLGMVLALAFPLRSFEADLHGTMDRVFTADLYISRGPEPQRQPLGLPLRDRIVAVDGVEHVSSERDVFLTVEGELMLAIVEPRADIVRYRDEVSSLADDEIAVSHLLARRLDVGPGDTLTLPTPAGERGFTVGGLFQQWTTLPTLSIASETYVRHWDDRSVDSFAVYVDPARDVDEVRHRLEELVRAEDLGASVITRDELAQDIIESVEGLLAMADSTLLIALIVAGLTIANTAFAAVLERRWELGMVQTLGMTRRALARMLLIEVTVVALIGCAGALVVGTVTGFGITEAVAEIYVLTIPFRAPVAMLAIVFGAGLGVTALATVLPRRLATRTPLIESLRFE